MVDRPEWLEGIENEKTVWMVYSHEKKVGYVRAETQKEALAKALEIGIVPENTHGVRPHTGRSKKEVMMDQSEFENILNKMMG